jgi:hypothetical protein
VTVAYVAEVDANVAVWRDQHGWAARIDEKECWRQTVIPHATALDALCAIAGVTPQEAWVRELSARATADDQPSW